MNRKNLNFVATGQLPSVPFPSVSEIATQMPISDLVYWRERASDSKFLQRIRINFIALTLYNLTYFDWELAQNQLDLTLFTCEVRVRRRMNSKGQTIGQTMVLSRSSNDIYLKGLSATFHKSGAPES